MHESGSADPAYVPRLVEGRVRSLLQQVPAVLVVGPRATGKTTMSQRLVKSTVRLDIPAEAEAFRADPDAALRGVPEPVLLDEWQVVPGVLGAVKRSVDTERRAGRFVLTGSVRADLEAPTWPGTGRLIRVPMYGLTVREQVGALHYDWLDALATGGAEALVLPASPPDLRGYLELALRSGFPEPAIHLSGEVRRQWLDSYLHQLITRDADLVDSGRDPERLRRYVQVVAAHTAQSVDDKTLYDAAGINRKTALAYEQLLQNLYILERLPAWSSNIVKQLVRTPKRHLVDPALAAAALNFGEDDLVRRGNLLGPIFESFVVAQIRADAAASPLRPRMYHLRDRGGRHEVDLVVELGGKTLGFEVKVSAAPTPAEARHLQWLADAHGDDFVGIVLHAGPRRYRLTAGVTAVPIAALWAG